MIQFELLRFVVAGRLRERKREREKDRGIQDSDLVDWSKKLEAVSGSAGVSKISSPPSTSDDFNFIAIDLDIDQFRPPWGFSKVFQIAVRNVYSQEVGSGDGNTYHTGGDDSYWKDDSFLGNTQRLKSTLTPLKKKMKNPHSQL